MHQRAVHAERAGCVLVQPREGARQLVGRHRQRDRLVVDRLRPAEVLQQPQVLGELAPEVFRVREVSAVDASHTSPIPLRWLITIS
jgi:hypothetical protein